MSSTAIAGKSPAPLAPDPAQPADVVLAQDVLVPVDPNAKAPNPNVYALPDDATAVTVQLARATSADPSKFPDPNSHVAFVAFASYDGGATWEHAGTMTTSGGITTHPQEGDIGYANLFPFVRPGKGRLLKIHQALICGPATVLDHSVAVR